MRNRYPLPLISQLLDQLSLARVFTKIDLRGAYNLVRIKPGDEWKTAFRTRYGHFEYKVMPFGLTNAPAVFQHMMNDIFREYLDQFVVIYLDDLLVFSKSQAEHDRHVKLVLEKLREVGLYAKLEKCEFDRDEVEFLGYRISKNGIGMDKGKISSILSWAPPKTVKEVQSFLGFANFYRMFIRNYSELATPLHRLTQKGKPFNWDSSAQSAFEELKKAFTSAPVLIHADPTKPFVVETDGSDFALGAVLSQVSYNDGQLHPVAFYSRKFTAAEVNYEIYDKELLAIIAAFEQWRHYLLGAQQRITVFTDHRNLLHYTTTRKLNRRQARWSLFLADFDFEIKFRPGKLQGKPDALSRRAEYHLEEGEESVTQQTKVLLKPRMLQLNSLYVAPGDSGLLDQVRDAMPTDEFANSIKSELEIPGSEAQTLFAFHDGLLFKKGLLYIPDQSSRTQVLNEGHDLPLAGHPGVYKTTELVKRNYWWPGMTKSIKDYVGSCDVCARSKTARHKPYGKLQPLPVPEKPWSSISMDFITDLPKSSKFDAILVVVDRLTKMAHFIPCTKSISAKETADLVLNNVIRLHGIPEDIISDRGPQFASKFWKSLFSMLGTKTKLSSAFHPETDGQTERVNQVLEQYLRAYVNYLQDNWSGMLSLAEFSYNNSMHASTKRSPFFANYGFHPMFNILDPRPVGSVEAMELLEVIRSTQEQLKSQLHQAQQNYKMYADRNRERSPSFKTGDKVWLIRKNIKTKRPSDKLDYKRLGPFEIISQVNPVTYRLKLPENWRTHDSFHVSLLEPFRENSFPDRKISPPLPIEVDGDIEYEVSKVLDSKFYRGKIYYLVDWTGYGVQEQTWEPASNLHNAAEAVKDFHNLYPEKPRPKRGHWRGGNVMSVQNVRSLHSRN